MKPDNPSGKPKELREEIIARLMKLPPAELQRRIRALKRAREEWAAKYRERLNSDPEFAERHRKNIAEDSSI